MKIKSYFSRRWRTRSRGRGRSWARRPCWSTAAARPPEARHLGEYEVVFVTDAPARQPCDGAETSPEPARAAGPALARTFRGSEARTGDHAAGADPFGLRAAAMERRLRRRSTRHMPCSPASDLIRSWRAPSSTPPRNARWNAGRSGALSAGAPFERALVAGTGIADLGPAGARPRRGQPHIVALVGPPGCGQDHHAGQTRGELRAGQPPSGAAALDGHLPGSGGGTVAVVRGHSGRRVSGARDASQRWRRRSRKTGARS